jgi:hypothetical protein
MSKIEWVELPAGEFVFGLSDEQAESIRQKIYEEVGYIIGDNAVDVLISSIIDMPISSKPRLNSEELNLLKSRKYGPIIRVGRMLRDLQYFPRMKLDTFYISRFPVTGGQLAEFVTKNSLGKLKNIYSRIYQNKDFVRIPAITSWHVADWFCQWVGGRLPTVAEWEKAARGVDGRLYPWGNEWDINRGNFDPAAPGYRNHAIENIETLATPVDSYPLGVSPFDVWDMCGNVYEWTSTVRVSEYGEGPLLKSCSVKHPTDFPWFDSILAFSRQGGREEIGSYEYTGFRPVKDKWITKYWQGWK